MLYVLMCLCVDRLRSSNCFEHFIWTIKSTIKIIIFFFYCKMQFRQQKHFQTFVLCGLELKTHLVTNLTLEWNEKWHVDHLKPFIWFDRIRELITLRSSFCPFLNFVVLLDCTSGSTPVSITLGYNDCIAIDDYSPI